MQKPAYRLYQVVWTALDWLYPPRCGGCQKAGVRWCSECRGQIELLPHTICEICGDTMNREGICNQCCECPPAFHRMRSWAYFDGPLRQAMHRLKYKRDIALGERLAQPLIAFWIAQGWQIDLVTAVPIGVARHVERGYNQSTLLAFPLALAGGLRYRSKALIKVRETRSQVGLNFAERRENTAKAFQADPKIVAAKSVLVVDDVATSGSTMQACAAALLSAGAARVFGLTLARARQDTA